MASPHPRRPRQPTVRRIKIEIPLPLRPADYVPNSGPPLRRLDLLPAADSTAYIDDRILLPPTGLAADGRPRPKRMKYIIGWRDLPAARLLVPAMDVLDYVSPRALEDWEYKMELELDVERARLAAERQALKTQTLQQGPASEVPKTKRPGRPPLHHTNIETAVVAEADDEDGKQPRHRGGAMSLSTPKKRKMDDFLDGYTSDESPSEQLLFDFARSKDQAEVSLAKDDAKGNDELLRVPAVPTAPTASTAPMVPAAPPVIGDDNERYRGIKSQFFNNAKFINKMTLPLMSAPAAAKPKTTPSHSPDAPLPPGKGSAREPTVKPSTQARSHSSRPVTDFLSAARSNGGTLQPPKRQAPSKAPSEAPLDKAQPRQEATPKQLSALARKYSGMSKTPKIRMLSKVPSQPQLNKTQSQPRDHQKPFSALARKFSGASKHLAQRVSSKAASQLQASEKGLPALAQKYSGTSKSPAQRVSSQTPSHTRPDKDPSQPQTKPKPSSALVQKYTGTSKSPSQRVSSEEPPRARLNKAQGQPQAKPKPASALAQKYSGTSKSPAQRALSKMPAGPHLGRTPSRPVARPKYRPHVAQKTESKLHARKMPSLKAKKPPPMPVFADSSSDSDSGDEDEEQSWDVERLEDMELFDVAGEGLVRYFKVRWEGDWPPEQNPTWEPEKNIAPELVADFCRTFRPRDGSRPLSETRHTSHDEDVLQLPPLRPTYDGGMDDVVDRPSSAHSGLFVYSSDDGMEKHTWDAPNSQGYRPNLNGVYPARMI